MPITVTDSKGNVTVSYRGEVVDVRKSVQDRDWSDTVDYSDWRATEVTEALVYVGRVAKHGLHRREAVPHYEGYPKAYYTEGEQLAPVDRFVWVDCTCLFRYRGQDLMVPRVDDIRHPDVVIALCEFLEARAELDRTNAARALAAETKKQQERAEAEKNRPVVGKQMVVASGRKVPVGTLGTVAFVRDDGRVLLKADTDWRDRKANGTWVDGRHLRARA